MKQLNYYKKNIMVFDIVSNSKKHYYANILKNLILILSMILS